ncbi:BamA/TamA family outer membrane protein [Formosa sp. 4Alg 33]|uniref:translocation and assembly module lipoprotein TamL n=1 Tax=Formosa sp. 4Alg 33 TaxID=3382189 RepID=UPI003D9C03F2
MIKYISLHRSNNGLSQWNRPLSFALLLLVLVSQSCSIQKHIPEDELLYTGGKIAIETDSILEQEDQLKSELENILRPEPNSKFLGIYPGLYYYYKTQREKPGFINNWLYKKIGEEPVYVSDVKTYEVDDIIVNRLENHGFFYSNSASTLEKNVEDKTGEALYTVSIKQPYTLASYQLDSIQEPIYTDIESSINTTQFKKGLRFDLAFLKTERQRIDNDLKSKGYYNFNPDFLIFEADTTRYTSRQFDLYLRLKNAVPKKSLVPYRVEKINIYSDYDIENSAATNDTIRFNNKNFIETESYFNPENLDPFITLKEGDYYNPQESRNTARRLSTIGTYKYVNIQYQEMDSLLTDSTAVLHANIYLSPLNKRALKAELQAVTKSNSFAGPALEFSYSNRNLFKGGEIFNLSTSLGYEFQVGGGNNNPSASSTSIGVKGEVLFPKVLFPFKISDTFFDYSIPKTKTSLGIDYLNRSDLYRLLSGTAEFGYLWNENRYTTHELNPISINYNNLIKTTPEFDEILEDNPFLQQSFDQEFIAGLNYSFTYNEMVDVNKKHQIYANTTVDIAGNVVSLFGKNNTDTRTKTFLGLEYAQYAKLDVDFRYHFNFNSDQKIATRLFAGYGMPYGNSDLMPYIKQYYSGGPNSVRAFSIRSLGPGTYEGTEDGSYNNFVDQTGNIRLEANVEYRFPLFSFFKGALFADAGNVWNSKENEALPGGKFSSDFMSQLGIGVGVGLRVDVQGFVIRFDFAAPVHDPTLKEGERYDFQYEETTFNFGIGYPF